MSQQIEIFDSKTFLDRVMEDRELATLILNTFLPDMQTQLKAFDEAFKKADWEMVQNYAHKIKGAAANVSADLLYHCAYNIESLMIAKLTDDAHHLNQELQSIFLETQQQMLHFISN